MKYKGYTGKVEYDDEAEAFYGEVIGRRDVVTFKGTSVRELNTWVADALKDKLLAKSG